MDNIMLIGMPTSGKSTFGKLLAEKTNKEWIDGDSHILIPKIGNLQPFIDKRGDEKFLEIEEKHLREIDHKNHIFSPGGSICYHQDFLASSKKSFKIIFLHIEFEELKSRLKDKNTRGIIGMKTKKTLKELYEERVPLYKKHAHHTIDVNDFDRERIIKEILEII